MSAPAIQLGLGLIGIGKPWGHVPRPVPSEIEVQTLLAGAVELGIRYFDTAPSYGDGVSEARLGQFLRELTTAERDRLTIATKMGEHWDAARGEPHAGHSYDALCRSLDASVKRLVRIDILQLHKTTPAVLRSDDLAKAWDYARSLGIARVGPSVSDTESANLALDDARYSVMQLPFNQSNPTFAPVLDRARQKGVWVAVNRPFAMGAMVHSGVEKAAAFSFILNRGFKGVVLTGTVALDHLRENFEAFSAALTL
jgi:aryl-alcohol dehydrogenase-like predicted oxidoreductase